MRAAGCLGGLLAFGVTVSVLGAGYKTYEAAQNGDCSSDTMRSCIADEAHSFGHKVLKLIGNSSPDEPTSKKTPGSAATKKPKQAVTDAARLNCAAKLPVATVAGQLVVAGIPAYDMDTAGPILKKQQVGGVILMTSPKDPTDGSVMAFKKSFGTYQPVISTDQEGGIVQRFTAFGKLPAAADVPAKYSPDAYAALIKQNGQQLKKIGIDQTFGTVADRAVGSNPALGSRSFSSKESVVTSYTTASAKGWLAAGVVPTMKHWPSVGTANTDFGASQTRPLKDLRQDDLGPYAGIPAGTAVMVANAVVPGLTDGKPASMSQAAISGELRGKEGFDGLVVTDSLLADAITADYSPAEAAVAAIAAGADQAVFSVATDPAENKAEMAAIPKITQALAAAIIDGSINRDQVNASVVRISKVQAKGICG